MSRLASKTFYSMRFANFRLWFVSNLFAATAMWMQRVAQIWVVLVVLTDNDAFAVGMTTALQFLPQLIFGFFGGALADWMDRRRMLQITQSGVALLGLILGVLLLTGSAQLFEIYLIAFVTGIFDALAISQRQTFISELVPADCLPNAVGLNSMAFNIARLIGPALAGVLIAVLGPGWVFVINTAIFVIPVVTLALMRRENFFAVKRGVRRRGMIREGFTYVQSRSDLKAIIFLITLTGAFGFNLQMTQAFMATDVYSKGPGEYGLLGTMLAIGSLSGALLAARRAHPRFAMVISGVFFFWIGRGAVGAVPELWGFCGHVHTRWVLYDHPVDRGKRPDSNVYARKSKRTGPLDLLRVQPGCHAYRVPAGGLGRRNFRSPLEHRFGGAGLYGGGDGGFYLGAVCLAAAVFLAASVAVPADGRPSGTPLRLRAKPAAHRLSRRPRLLRSRIGAERGPS